MEQNTSPELSMRDLLAARGVVVTDEGMARARRKRLAARKSDPQAREALLAKLRQGVAPA